MAQMSLAVEYSDTARKIMKELFDLDPIEGWAGYTDSTTGRLMDNYLIEYEKRHEITDFLRSEGIFVK